MSRCLQAGRHVHHLGLAIRVVVAPRELERGQAGSQRENNPDTALQLSHEARVQRAELASERFVGDGDDLPDEYVAVVIDPGRARRESET